ncbi:MAG: GGDEF domain-containing protein [Plesiomonas sp.]|uniref:GGDEF domain-containing protein n=1 Tax=Plesiomonas sp. TaxID=2486279 RepID=UPI003F301A1C
MRQHIVAKLFTLLLIFTVAAVALHPMITRRVIRVDASNVQLIEPMDDRARGGATEAQVSVDDNGHINLYCTLKNVYRWPYCEVSLILSSPEDGLDLSDFNRIQIPIRSTGVGPQFWRVYLRNYDPAYSRPDDSLSHKVNQLIVQPSDTHNFLDMPLSAFQVASWWVNDKKIPVTQALPQFNRIFQIELASSELMQEGEHHVAFDYIEFHGSWISEEYYYLLIIAIWVICTFAYLLGMQLQMRRELTFSQKRQQQLTDLNTMLKLRNEEVEYQAKYDPLTGAFNRYGARTLMLEMLRQSESQEPSALILLDIDHFKHINDTYGHLVGDEVLQHLAHRCRSLINPRCRLVRWGGEEFMLLCPDFNRDQAHEQAELLRQEFVLTQWPLGIRVTVSLGVVELALHENIADTINRADIALYKAKNSGRNCVVVG